MSLADGDIFNPLAVLHEFPHAQLWNKECKCIKRSRYKELEEEEAPLAGGQEADVPAVHFCSKLFENDKPNDFLLSKAELDKLLREKGLDESLCQSALKDLVKEDLLHISSATKSMKQALKHVCHQECTDIVRRTREKVKDVAFAGHYRQGSYSEICSTVVVKKVESHLLGCCANSCGWNNQT